MLREKRDSRLHKAEGEVDRKKECGDEIVQPARIEKEVRKLNKIYVSQRDKRESTSTVSAIDVFSQSR